MATDATGTPTSLGIRKYNTSVDAPSGLGFNGAMDDIDALLVARVTKPTGVLTNDVPVWNGTTWVKPTGSHTGTNFLRDDGSWAAAGATTQKKTAITTVNTTVAATDLLAGGITIGAGALGTTGVARLTAWGDSLQNSGGAAAPPRFQLLLGGTVILDTGVSGTLNAGTERGSWRMEALISAQASTAAQYVDFLMTFAPGHQFATQTTNVFTTGNGVYEGDTGVVNGIIVGKGGAAATKDSTAALAVVLNVINGSASASYETKNFGALLEIL